MGRSFFVLALFLVMLGAPGYSIAENAGEEAMPGKKSLVEKPAEELKVFALKFTPADTAAKLVQQVFRGKKITAAADVPSNTLVVRGDPSSLNAVEALLMRIDQASPESHRIEVTLWEVTDTHNEFDEFFSKAAQTRLPCELKVTQCEKLVKQLAGAGLVGNSISLQSTVLEDQQVSMSTSARVPVKSGAARTSRSGTPVYSYTYENIGCKVNARIANRGAGVYVELHLEDSRFTHPAQQQADAPAVDPAKAAEASLNVELPSIVSTTVQTTLGMAEGNAELISAGGNRGKDGTRLLIMVAVGKE